MIETHSPETEATPDADPRIQEWLELVAWPQEDYSVRETKPLSIKPIDANSYRATGIADGNLEHCQEMWDALIATLDRAVNAEPDARRQQEGAAMLASLKNAEFAWELLTSLPVALGVARARRTGELCVLDANARIALRRNLPYYRLCRVVDAISSILGPDSPWERLMLDYRRLIVMMNPQEEAVEQELLVKIVTMSPQEETLEKELLAKIVQSEKTEWRISKDVRQDIRNILQLDASPN